MMAHYSEQQGNWKPLKGDTDNTLRHNLPNRHHGGVNLHLRAGSAESPILVWIFRGNERPHVSPNVDDSIPRFVLVPFPNCGCYGFFLLLYSGRGFSSFYRMIAHMFFFDGGGAKLGPNRNSREHRPKMSLPSGCVV